MKRKLISLLCVVVLLLSLLPSNVFAVTSNTESPVIAVENVWGSSGQTVEVNVSIENNPGILGGTFTISWAEELELISAKKQEAFDELNYQKPSKYEPAGTNFIWYGESVSEVLDGNILTLTFKVDDTAIGGSNLDVNVVAKQVINTNKETIPVTCVNGGVQVVNYIPGDVNSDQVVDILDVITLVQYVSDDCTTKPDGFNISLIEEAADVNDDGAMDILDVILICQYVSDGCMTNPNGYNVTLMPSTPKCQHTAMISASTKNATCTENGNVAYWYCGDCDSYFDDADGKNKMSAEDVVIVATGHTEVVDRAIAPTYSTTGLTEGSHCSVCKTVIVEQQIIPILQKTEYAVTYHIANNDPYLAGIDIENDNPTVYTTEDGLVLQGLMVEGYNFKGWFTAQTGGTQVTEIAVGSTGNKVLYAQWEKVEYTVTFDSPDVPVPSVTYTVDKGVTLTNPSWFGYTFVGWSVNGEIISSISPGTTGNITLHANWTSNRNRATAVNKLDDPIVIEDQEKAQYLFVYEIGTIENVPLSVIEYIGNSQGLSMNTEYSYTQSISESFADTIAKSVSNATTKSSSWTLSEEWNDIASATNENEEAISKTAERTDSQGNVVDSKYYISNSESGSTSSTNSKGGSSATSSKVTNNTSTGLNGSYARDHQVGGSVSLDVGNSKSHTDNSQSNWNASGNIGYAAGNAGGIEGGVTIGGGHSWGDSDTTGSSTNTHLEVTGNDSASANIAFSRSNNVGTEKANSSESHWDNSSTATSAWNTEHSYENATSASTNLEVSNAISEAIYNRYSYTSTSSRGGGNSSAQSTGETQELSNEYASTIEYRSDESTSITKKFTYSSDATGYYRLVNAGTVHVFAVVGYDIATNSYFTYTYNVLDQERHEYLDYSKNNANFNDCENAIIPFEVPYYVNEFVDTVISRSKGLVVNADTGVIEEYTGDAELVIVPQYVSVDNGDGTFSAVRIRGISAEAFKGNSKIKGVSLPKYVYEIPDSAFEGCTSLEVVIGYGIAKIGSNAFKGCVSLKEFAIDQYIAELGENAFQDAPEIVVVAANKNVADAALTSGAKRITLNLSELEEPIANTKIDISEDTEYFALIGNGSNYTNVQIESDAAETFISNMNFIGNMDTPFKFSSKSVTLSRVTVTDCPGFAMILTSDQTTVSLYGTIELSSMGDSALISKNVILQKANAEVAGKLRLTGDYLLCGEITNQSMLNFADGELITIDESTYNSMLTSSVITFNANGGSLTNNTKTVYYGQYYGEMPMPTRTGYAFDGWYTEQNGGTKVTSETVVSALANQTLYAHWTTNAYNVSWNTGTGYTIAVNRTSSPYANASTGSLSNGAVVYYGDVLSVTYTASTGYSISSKGSTSITVNGNVTSANIYASVSVNSYTASWNAGTGCSITVKRTSSPRAGASIGNISSGAKVYYGDVLSVTYAKQDYYTITSKGSTSITVTGNVTSSNIYATATLNSVSGWVKASEMPSGAQVINTKWSYTLREYGTNSASSVSGWTKYDTKRTSWGATQGPVYSDPSNGSRNVWSEKYVTSSNYKTVYNYYYYSKAETGYGTSYYPTNTYGKNKYSVTLDSELSKTGTTYKYNGYTIVQYKMWHTNNTKYRYVYACYAGEAPYEYKSQKWVSDNYGTRWYYQEPVYTYYYYRDLSKEATSDPTGQSNVSNVVKWVQYRAK